MTIITEKPEGLKSSNDLDYIVDPDEQTPERTLRAEIQMSGKTMTVVENPPDCGDTITLMVELKVTAEGREKRKSSDEYAYYRKTRLVACWLPGGAKPERKKTQAELDAEAAAAAAENQPPLYPVDDNGQPVEDTDEVVDEDQDDDFGRPPFSDGADD